MNRRGFAVFLLTLVMTLGAVRAQAQGKSLLARIAPGPVARLIKDLEVGEVVYHQNLSIIPIYARRIKDNTRYTTLEEALRCGWLEIEETGGGRVPQVKLTNRSSNHIYLMGGEILTGCKQDRIVGRDVLIKSRRKNLLVPVYCVEQGRWSHNSDRFYSKKNLGDWQMRGMAQERSSNAQAEIWSQVARSASKLGVQSTSSAYQDTYDSDVVKRRLHAYERRLENIPELYDDTVGAVVAVGGTIISVDIFANPYLFRELWPKILKSSALAAVASDQSGSLTQRQAVAFLRALHDKHYHRNAAIDLGYELAALDSEVNANALVYRGAVMHLAAFPSEGGRGFRGTSDDEQRTPVMQRFMWR